MDDDLARALAKNSRDPRAPVADVLRDAIRQRLLPPGMPLIQSALAAALGVSKIPVREALHALASEGIVTFTDEGARVTALAPEEIDELWSLRALIEPALAEAIARNVSPAELTHLGELVESMERAESGDAWSDLNYIFHSELYRISDLPHFAGVASRVLTLIEPDSRVAVNRLQGRGAAQAEHREMIAALQTRDGGRLNEVLERHSTRARDLLVGYARSAGSDRAARASATSDAARAFATRLFEAQPGLTRDDA